MMKSILEKIQDPGCWAVLNYRVASFFWKIKLLRVFYFLYYPVWRFWVLVTGVEIYGKTAIGKGFKVAHFGQVFINPRCIIGDNCIVYNGVTIGAAQFDGSGGTPIIGDNVRIGAGVKLLGNIKIGNHCDIGANAVVLDSFPDGSVIAGIPAREIKQKGRL